MQIKSKVWSNFFFVIPLIISLQYRLYFHSLLITLVMVFSSIYHFTDEKKFGSADRNSAYSLIAYNLYLCYLAEFSFPYFWLALLFVLIGFYFLIIKKKDDYEWHISSALITVFCLLAYTTI